MPELIVLGTAASVPDAEHDTIGLLLRGRGWCVPVECGGSTLHKLARLCVDMDTIRAVVLTHRHADHIYGLPMLVQGLWLSGREDPLPVYGPGETLDVARTMLGLFGLDERPDMFTLDWHPVPLREDRTVLEVGEVRISSTPGIHGDVDVLALRFTNIATGRSIAYSSDTGPCRALVRLAAGVDLLIHEASGGDHGHSSPAQAGEVAREAGAEKLALIHYPVRGVDLEAWRLAASEFPGQVTLAQDGDVYPL